MKPYLGEVIMSSQLPMVRLALNVIASIGVSKVINDIISNNVNVETTAEAVKVWTGSIVLGSMIVDHASDHLNGRMDAVLAWHESRKADPTTAQ
jgi:hypothetical protein